MRHLAQFLRAIAPWFWVGTCLFGMWACVRLGRTAQRARKRLGWVAVERDNDYLTLTYLRRLAFTAFALLLGQLVIGILSIARPQGDDLTAVAALVVLLLTPLGITWIVYRAFWLRIGGTHG